MNHTDAAYLEPTAILDSDHPRVRAFAAAAINGSSGRIEKAVRLFYAVRDGIRYDPYTPFHLPGHYRASEVIARGRGYCVAKAALLCALGRSAGIPSRIGFADVRNHIATRELIDTLGSNLFVYHGFTEFYLEGKWVRATPAFNRELCERHATAPLEFNGRDDSIFSEYNREDRRFMEYVAYHDTYADVPVGLIIAEWEKEYGAKRVRQWISLHEAAMGGPVRDFDSEEVVKG
ncbi:MAG TPA: transglutaminase-like domain-containing protein [Spirochaetota bacterium]|nr:transglutaminase-like domain-containing protein [Spirochaetota bacterium]